MSTMSDEPRQAARADAFRELAMARRSCRAFLPTAVPKQTITEILKVAQRAASWCNTQPWQVIVTSGEAPERFRKSLYEHAAEQGSRYVSDVPMPPAYTGVHLERRRETGWQLYEAVGIERGDRAASGRQALRNYEFFDAPHVAIITVDAGLGPYAILDTGVYLGQLLLAAESFGVGATAQAALATYSPFIRDFFDIAEDRAVLVGVSFGWPDDDHPANSYRTNRADVEDVATWIEH